MRFRRSFRKSKDKTEGAKNMENAKRSRKVLIKGIILAVVIIAGILIGYGVTVALAKGV